MVLVLCGDAAEQISKLDNDSVDMVLTSPPYDNIRKYDHAAKADFTKILSVISGLYRVLRSGGVLVWVVNDAHGKNRGKTQNSFRHALHAAEVGFLHWDTMIYKKPGGGYPQKAHRYTSAFEYMFIFSKGIPNRGELMTTEKTGRIGKTSRRGRDGIIRNGKYNIGGGFLPNVQEFHRGKRVTKHPAAFPVSLAEFHIKSWSNAGDTVLDPFFGSGTTGIACNNLGRKCIGIDWSQAYCDEAKEWLGLDTGIDIFGG